MDGITLAEAWYNQAININHTIGLGVFFAEFDGFVSRITDLTNANLDALRLQRATWGAKFVEAMNVNGGDVEHASVFDYVMHFFTFGWKVYGFAKHSSSW